MMDFHSLFSAANDFIVQENDCAALPEIGPQFSVPALPEKPQDPILDSLHNIHPAKNLSTPQIRAGALPQELAVVTAAYANPLLDRPLDNLELWRGILSKRRFENQALFWDRMRPDVSLDKPSSTPFISEQDDMIYSVARDQSQHLSHDSFTNDRIYLSQSQYLASLRSIVLGTSSRYHVWDAKQERFGYVKAAEGREGCLIVDGKAEVLCRSVTQRFLTIGTLIRRLETLISTLRARSANEGPTIHAFAHSISTILAYLRDDISLCSTDAAFQGRNLSDIWSQYAIHEDILVALSSFYGRSESVTPEEYPFLDSMPIPLLNCIYDGLRTHMDRHSPRIIVAVFAFALATTGQDYLREISHTVGYGDTYIKKSTHVVGERPDQYTTDEVQEEEEETYNIFDAMEKLGTEFPTFFPKELLDVLPAAQKSLILLREAQPEHPLLVSPEGQAAISWFWTEKEIDAAWRKTVGKQEVPELESQPAPTADVQSSVSYKPELGQFRVFDQEPGFYHGPSTLKSESVAMVEFRAFVDSFPERLPPITPTLSHLASLVFSRLVEHASKLSDTLLMVFLSPDGNLNLRAHLELLRSFLLVTSPEFESRLSAALFSDAEEYELDVKSKGMSFQSLRRRASRKVVAGTQPWAVGLAAALLDPETWPPVDADLGFFLRTVIVDSIGRNQSEVVGERDKVSEEAEYRLGFAIRDLPAGSGKEKWLNPLSIEALDFLYMDYKPPLALEALITLDILSKYRRMFAFILRLMRVTHALKAVYRMSRLSSKPIFETLVKYRKIMFHFRLVAHSLISNLSAYVFDTVIGGNFDPFIERLAVTTAAAASLPIYGAVSPPSTSVPHFQLATQRFSDVFSLSQSHSELLDNVLSACLLRSGQREVGDILRQALELVLEFSVVIGERHRGRLEEYEAGPMVEELFLKFRAKMMMFTRVLKELAEKTGGNSSTRAVGDDAHHEGSRRAIGGMEALSHLMIKLDMGDWWTQV